MTVGSTYAAAKAAIVAQLAVRSGLSGVAVAGEPPVEPLKVMGSTGSGKAIWIADSEGEYDNVVICGPGRLDIEELYSLTIVFQAVPVNASETQATTDLRVDEMLGEFLLEMAADVTWGLSQFTQFETTRGGFKRYVGPVTDRNIRPSRCELDLDVRARISITP